MLGIYFSGTGNTKYCLEKFLEYYNKNKKNKLYSIENKNCIKEIKESNYKLLYNVKTDNYENITKTKVLDSKEVLISAVSNAVSIAGMILTTTSIVINEYQNNLNKVNDYNEL